MKLKEFITEAGFLSAFKQGYADQQAGHKAAPKTAAPAAPAAKSPFDIIPKKDAKFILQNIIEGKPLDANQMALIKKVYNQL